MGRIRTTVAATTLTVAVLATGCGGGDELTASDGRDAERSTTTESTTTTEATTTTAPIDYGRQYLDLVAASNCALSQMIDASTFLDDVEYIDDATWARIQQELLPAVRAYSDATVAFYEGLAAAEWPENVQADIDTMVAQLASEAAEARSVADATSIEAYVAHMEPFVERDDNAAGVVRAKLGLESNVTDEADYCAATA